MSRQPIVMSPHPVRDAANRLARLERTLDQLYSLQDANGYTGPRFNAIDAHVDDTLLAIHKIKNEFPELQVRTRNG